MIYTIVLPALIVISLGVIIVFLTKKAPAVKKVEEKGQFEEKLRKEEKKNFWQKMCFFCNKSLFPCIKSSAVFLVKKGFSLIKSLFVNLFSKKEKKKKKDEVTQGDDAVLQKVKEYSPRKTEKTSRIIDEEEKIVRPMVSDKIVKPKSKTEMKDRFEEILIERVAANPKDVEAYERLGEYYFEIDELEDAKECFKQVIKLDATNHRAKAKMRKLENN